MTHQLFRIQTGKLVGKPSGTGNNGGSPPSPLGRAGPPPPAPAGPGGPGGPGGPKDKEHRAPRPHLTPPADRRQEDSVSTIHAFLGFYCCFCTSIIISIRWKYVFMEA